MDFNYFNVFVPMKESKKVDSRTYFELFAGLRNLFHNKLRNKLL